jgi:hypothetical protein
MGTLRERVMSYFEDPGRDARESSEAVGREQLAALIRDNLAQQRLDIETQWTAYLHTDTPEEAVDMHYLGMIEAHNSVAEVLNSEVSAGRLPLILNVPVVDPDTMSEAVHLQARTGLGVAEVVQFHPAKALEYRGNELSSPVVAAQVAQSEANLPVSNALTGAISQHIGSVANASSKGKEMQYSEDNSMGVSL